MIPDTLSTVPAVVDSAAVVNATAGFVGPFVHAWLSGFKNLSPAIVDSLTALATSAATIATLAGVRWLLVLFTTWSSTFRAILSPLWDRNRGWLNPLLAVLLGHIDGSALAGALAVAIHAGVRGVAKSAGKATPQGVARSARIMAFAIAIIACASVAHAGVADLLRPATKPIDPPLSAFALQRFAVQLGVGAQANGWVYSRGTTGFVEAQAAYQWTNALGLRVGVRRETVARAPLKPEARLTLTFAP